MTTEQRRLWSALLLVAFALILFIGAAALFFTLSKILGNSVIPPIALWLAFLVATVLLLIGLGIGANDLWYGALLDSRNRTSLSRLQITAWTVISMTGWMAIALSRVPAGALAPASPVQIATCQDNYLREVEGIANIETLRVTHPVAAEMAVQQAVSECTPQALNVVMPTELLAALGLSTVSLAGSSLVKSTKKRRVTVQLRADLERRVQAAQLDLDNAVAAEASAQSDEEVMRLGLAADNARAIYNNTKYRLDIANKGSSGTLKTNSSPSDAKLTDIFYGEEISNHDQVDLSKVQMFFISGVIIIGYSAMLIEQLGSPTIFEPFSVILPVFSGSMNTLLAISHGGYLVTKSVDHA
jgi:hypothetical protein